MTTELTKAAQQALEACHEHSDGRHREDFDGTCIGCGAVMNPNNPHQSALTQRPAAQEVDEREEFEAEIRCEETWGHRSLRKHVDGRYQNWVVDALWTAWQARASLTAPQQATPSRFGSPDLQALIVQHATQQAAPEPSRGMIGMGAYALANELAQAVAQDDADPDGHDMSAGLFGPNVSAWLRKISADYPPQPATPEPVGEPVGRIAKFFNDTEALVEFSEPHAGAPLRAGDALYIRPAPGVPEGWRNVIAGTLKTDPWDSARVADYNSGWNDCQRKTLRGLERLAAAQAKGVV